MLPTFSKNWVWLNFYWNYNTLKGTEILITGETTGAYEDTVKEMRVKLEPVDKE